MAENTQPAAIAIASAPTRTAWKDWLPVLSTLLVIGGLLITGGRMLGQVAENTRRIDGLERRADQRDVQLGDMQVRIARMDAKLDVLVERARDPRP